MRYASGKKAALPGWALNHIIAARYGATPMAVREWPADDFLHAVSIEPYLGPRGKTDG